MGAIAECAFNAPAGQALTTAPAITPKVPVTAILGFSALGFNPVLMSGEGKRGAANRPKQPHPSSTLPIEDIVCHR